MRTGTQPLQSPIAYSGATLARCITDIRRPYYVVHDEHERRIGLAPGEDGDPPPVGARVLGRIAPIYPEWLGDRRFAEAHHCRFPYVVGEMARGVATPAMVVSAANTGFLGFYGAAGLNTDALTSGLREIARHAGTRSWGSNLIHTPNEPGYERAVVDLYLHMGVTRVSASAFMALTPQIVRYAYHGLRAEADGTIHRKNHVFAKVSRIEVARQFMRPAPPEILQALIAQRLLTSTEATLARYLPVAEDITAEADSGGHTDNRPLSVLLPILMRERDRCEFPVRVGAAGGIGTPSAAAAAFSSGAAYILTGSINQTAVESGLSAAGRVMLSEAGMADVAMVPSADMFELGVKVQVLRKGTLYPQRAARLYELYRTYASLDEVPVQTKAELERDVFRRSIPDIERDVQVFFAERDPAQWERATADPRHRMALVFRWYLGQSSHWPIAGDPSRRLDYQIWCGPAIGAFNEWVRDSCLADLETRTVAHIGLSLMEGAAIATRAQQARAHGIDAPASLFDVRPQRLA